MQGNGATTNFFGRNRIDCVGDGVYHLGFDIRDGRLLNEDGDPNATLAEVATWLNFFYGAAPGVLGDEAANTINGCAGDDVILAGYGADILDGRVGDDRLSGASGPDTFVFGKSWGRDVVTDYKDGVGRLDLRDTGVKQLKDLHITALGRDALISWHGNEVLLLGVKTADLEISDFIL